MKSANIFTYAIGVILFLGCQPKIVTQQCSISSTGASGLRTVAYEFQLNQSFPSKKAWFVVGSDSLLCNSTEKKVNCFYNEDPEQSEEERMAFFEKQYLSGMLVLEGTNGKTLRLPVKNISINQNQEIRP